MRYITTILIFTLFATWANAEEAEKSEEPKLSPATQRAVDSFEKDIAEARANFNKAVKEAKEDMSRALKREMKSVMRRGNLEEANAIKELQEKLVERTGLEKRDFLGKVIEKKEKAQSTQSMAGKWRIVKTNGWDKILTIFDNNSVVASNGLKGKLSVQDNKVYIKWNGGDMWESVNLPIADEMSGDGWDGKDNVKLIRVKN